MDWMELTWTPNDSLWTYNDDCVGTRRVSNTSRFASRWNFVYIYDGIRELLQVPSIVPCKHFPSHASCKCFQMSVKSLDPNHYDKNSLFNKQATNNKMTLSLNWQQQTSASKSIYILLFNSNSIFFLKKHFVDIWIISHDWLKSVQLRLNTILCAG